MVDGGREVFDGMTENLVPVIKLSAYLQTPTHPFSKDRDTRFQKTETPVFKRSRYLFSQDGDTRFQKSDIPVFKTPTHPFSKKTDTSVFKTTPTSKMIVLRFGPRAL